jgi:hypothetical protein
LRQKRTVPAVSKSSGPKSAGAVARILGTIFFGVFLAMGLLFTALLAREVAKTLRPWFWTKADCVIIESKVRQGTGDAEGRWLAEITYRFDDPTTGRAQTSSRVNAHGLGSGNGFEDAGTAHRLVRRFPADSRAICYAQGSGSGEVVLLRKTPWVVLTLLFPLIFVAIGGGGIFAMWWWRGSKTAKPKARSQQPSAARAALFVRGFFLLFFLIGAGAGYGFFIKPAWKIAQAKSWPTIPCEIVRSGVKTKSDSDGDTHRVDIHYRYEIAGEPLDGNRYSFFGGSSSGYREKRAIADRYQPGSRVTCFVNPADPTDAVLDRGFVGELWFGLIPAVFCAVGLLGFLFIKPKAGALADATGLPTAPAMEAGSVKLKAQATPLGKFLVVFFFAALWNGMVAFLFVKMHQVPWWFKGIFGVAGLAILSGAVHQFLALFNPRPILTVNGQALPLGGELQLDWRFRGNARRIRRLRIFLCGREEATYRRGTDTTTDRHTFAELELFNDTDAAALASGQASVTIPADSMHTFLAPNNKIVWSLHVKGEIPKWPDVDEEFPITVLPRSTTS